MSRLIIQSRKLAATFVICSIGAISAHSSWATTCPPGYDGAAPHCQPKQAKSSRPHTARSATSSSIAPISSPHSSAALRETVDGARLGPQRGAPVELRSHAAQMHGIIFVGGKNAINSQPVPPGHSPDKRAINSQPVPPGRGVHRRPRPSDPVERGGHAAGQQPV